MSVLHPIIGHERLRRRLASARTTGSLPAALLLHGPAGVGKQRLAHWVAQLILCEAPGSEGPCDACRHCRLSRRLEHPDQHWYMPLPRPKGSSTPEKLRASLESARIDRIQEVRESPLRYDEAEGVVGVYMAAVQGLRERAIRRPSMAERQIFVIGNAEALVPQEASHEAANALLKVLEEPSPSTTYILTSSQPHQLLPTVRSRTVPIHVGPLPTAQVASALREHVGIDESEARRLAGLSRGSLGIALGFLANDDSEAPLQEHRSRAFALLEAALGDARFETALGFPSSKARELAPLLDALGGWIRDLAALESGSEQDVTNADRIADLKRLSRSLAGAPGTAFAEAVDQVLVARHLAAANVNPQLITHGLARGLHRALLGNGADRPRGSHP